MGILDSARPLQDDVPWVKMCLHGKPGVGKTTFCADAPDPVYIDFERSTEVLRHTPGKEKIAVFRPANFKEVTEFVREAPKKYSTIIFDTVSSMQVHYMNEYMAKEGEKPSRDKYLPYQGDYRYATNELTDLWLSLQQMECNVIFIAHTKTTENEQGVITGYVPAMTPAVREALSQFINVIGYMEIKSNALTKKVDRLLYLNPTNTILAKNRLGIREPFLTNPTFGDLFHAS